jgi:hypothetical protein
MVSQSLTLNPTDDAINELRRAWSWLLPSEFEPVLFSIFGDVFFRGHADEIFWLNTGTAEITLVAHTEVEFLSHLELDVARTWFLPDLVEALHSEGKTPDEGFCYTYAVLPIFENGKYEPWNFKPVPAKEHFGLTGEVHAQLISLPEGTKVQIVVEQ